MVETFRQNRCPDGERRHLINYFEMESFRPAVELSTELANPPRRLPVLFGDDTRLFQVLDAVFDATHEVRIESEIEFLLMGRGAAESTLRAQAGELVGSTVRFVGHHSQEIAERALAEADLGLISISPGVCRVAYPSKTMTYLKADCPVLVMVEQDSELAEMVREREVGATCAPADAEALAEAVLAASRGGPVDEARRAHIRRVGTELFSRERALARWSELFRGLAAS